MDFVEPSGNGFQNYVWDTQSLNLLATDNEMIECCKRAYIVGHRYYITLVQVRELAGWPDRKMNYDDPNAWGTRQDETFRIMETLDFHRLSCVAVLYPGFTILDGSMRLLGDSGLRMDMFYDIYNNNNHHKRDAIIAEAVVYHGCTLVTNDERLRKKVNKYFPGTAITYAEYKNVLSSIDIREDSDHAD